MRAVLRMCLGQTDGALRRNVRVADFILGQIVAPWLAPEPSVSVGQRWRATILETLSI